MKLILVAVLLGNFQVTSYRSVKSQTDSSPFFTSIGERCNVHGIAVSQNLLAKNGGPINYGDLVYVEDIGYRIINDCMGIQKINQWDVWVTDHKEETKFDKKFGHKKLHVWLIQKEK